MKATERHTGNVQHWMLRRSKLRTRLMRFHWGSESECRKSTSERLWIAQRVRNRNTYGVSLLVWYNLVQYLIHGALCESTADLLEQVWFEQAETERERERKEIETFESSKVKRSSGEGVRRAERARRQGRATKELLIYIKLYTFFKFRLIRWRIYGL